MTHYPTPPGVRQWRVNLDIDRPDQGPRTRLERVRRTLLSRLPCGDYFRWAYHGGRPTGLGDCDLQSPQRRTLQRERGTRYQFKAVIFCRWTGGLALHQSRTVSSARCLAGPAPIFIGLWDKRGCHGDRYARPGVLPMTLQSTHPHLQAGDPTLKKPIQ